MTWFLLWLGLVLGALAVLGLLGWRLFRKGLAVMREVGQVGEAVADTTAAREAAFDVWLERRADEDLAAATAREGSASGSSGRTPSHPATPAQVPLRRTMSRTDLERS